MDAECVILFLKFIIINGKWIDHVVKFNFNIRWNMKKIAIEIPLVWYSRTLHVYVVTNMGKQQKLRASTKRHKERNVGEKKAEIINNKL